MKITDPYRDVEINIRHSFVTSIYLKWWCNPIRKFSEPRTLFHIRSQKYVSKI